MKRDLPAISMSKLGASMREQAEAERTIRSACENLGVRLVLQLLSEHVTDETAEMSRLRQREAAELGHRICTVLRTTIEQIDPLNQEAWGLVLSGKMKARPKRTRKKAA